MKSIYTVVLIILLAAWSVSASFGAELFANGDFEAGVTGFTSDYAFNGVTNTGEGTYAVVSSPNSVHPSWGIFGDHTTGAGLMQTANGSTTSGLAVWRQTVDVVPNADYTFSAWAASSFANNPATLSFRANDAEFLTLLLSASVGGWTQATTVINAGANSSIEFEIVDTNTFGNGNDFTLDDISLEGPQPIPEPATLAVALAGVALIASLRVVQRRAR